MQSLLGAGSSGAGSSTDPPSLCQTLLSPQVIVPALWFMSGVSNQVGASAYVLLQLNADISPHMQTVITSVAGLLPWDFKIFVAFLSDWMPICGRRRIPYLSTAVALQVVERILVGTLAPTANWLLLDAFLATCAQVVIGVMVDTLAVQGTRQEAAESPRDIGNLQTNSWMAMYAGNLLGTLGGSVLMDAAGWSISSIFYFAALLKVVMLLITFAVTDPPIDSSTDVCGQASARASSLLGEVGQAMRYRRVWAPALFIWIWQLHPTATTALNDFMLGTPNATLITVGPQPLGFSATEWSIQGSVGTIGTLLGGFAFKYCLKGMDLRWLFGATILLGALIYSLHLFVATGLVGADNGAFVFTVGDSLVESAVSFMLSMPILILIAAICPDGAMSTTYALITCARAPPTRTHTLSTILS